MFVSASAHVFILLQLECTVLFVDADDEGFDISINHKFINGPNFKEFIKIGYFWNEHFK